MGGKKTIKVATKATGQKIIPLDDVEKDMVATVVKKNNFFDPYPNRLVTLGNLIREEPEGSGITDVRKLIYVDEGALASVSFLLGEVKVPAEGITRNDTPETIKQKFEEGKLEFDEKGSLTSKRIFLGYGDWEKTDTREEIEITPYYLSDFDEKTQRKICKGAGIRLPKELTSPLEEVMRPGDICESGFIGPHESLEYILKKDDEVVKNLGVTHEELGKSLEEIMEKIPYNKESEVTHNDKELYVSSTVWRGGVGPCPWARLEQLKIWEEVNKHAYGSEEHTKWRKELHKLTEEDECGSQSSHIDYIVIDKEGNSIKFPQMAPHLIREHGFYQGREGGFRVEPEKIYNVLFQ